jgi:hypothetical protein
MDFNVDSICQTTKATRSNYWTYSYFDFLRFFRLVPNSSSESMHSIRQYLWNEEADPWQLLHTFVHCSVSFGKCRLGSSLGLPQSFRSICETKKQTRIHNILTFSWTFCKFNFTSQLCQLMLFAYYVYTYIPLTLYPRRGSRGISDIPPRHPRFTKIT